MLYYIWIVKCDYKALLRKHAELQGWRLYPTHMDNGEVRKCCWHSSMPRPRSAHSKCNKCNKGGKGEYKSNFTICKSFDCVEWPTLRMIIKILNLWEMLKVR